MQTTNSRLVSMNVEYPAIQTMKNLHRFTSTQKDLTRATIFGFMHNIFVRSTIYCLFVLFLECKRSDGSYER